MVYMSHYASEPMSAWDDKLTWDLDEAYAEVSRLIRRENTGRDED